MFILSPVKAYSKSVPETEGVTPVTLIVTPDGYMLLLLLYNETV